MRERAYPRTAEPTSTARFSTRSVATVVAADFVSWFSALRSERIASSAATNITPTTSATAAASTVTRPTSDSRFTASAPRARARRSPALRRGTACRGTSRLPASIAPSTSSEDCHAESIRTGTSRSCRVRAHLAQHVDARAAGQHRVEHDEPQVEPPATARAPPRRRRPRRSRTPHSASRRRARATAARLRRRAHVVLPPSSRETEHQHLATGLDVGRGDGERPAGVVDTGRCRRRSRSRRAAATRSLR